jgi:mono/diheme cytochrome c family protein
VLADAPPFLMVAPNLTTGRGGIAADYTDAQWERAIRHGVSKSGRGLAVMPSDAFAYLDDAELSAMVAYLKTLPAIDNELPAMELRPLGRILAGAGQITPISDLIDHERAHLTAPPVAPTAAYGEYRANLCKACHGADLLGAPHPEPGAPFSPTLASVKGWTLEQFKATMRTGMRPSGIAMDDKYMPWSAFGKMTDDEFAGLYAYLQTLPSVQQVEETD